MGPIIDPNPGPTLDIDVAAPDIEVIKSRPVNDNNAVIGSSTGYEKILELVGVGYRAALKGNKLNLQLGYSHDIDFDIPDGIKIAVEKQTP